MARFPGNSGRSMAFSRCRGKCSYDSTKHSEPKNIPNNMRDHHKRRPLLQEGWVIANHILVSFHVAFISSVLALPAAEIFKGEVLKFIFVSPETIISALFMYVSVICFFLAAGVRVQDKEKAHGRIYVADLATLVFALWSITVRLGEIVTRLGEGS